MTKTTSNTREILDRIPGLDVWGKLRSKILLISTLLKLATGVGCPFLRKTTRLSIKTQSGLHYTTLDHLIKLLLHTPFKATTLLTRSTLIYTTWSIPVYTIIGGAA